MIRLIRHGRVIDPANRTDEIRDLAIDEQGRISAEPIEIKHLQDAEIIDASGCWVTPGLVDLAVRFREPGQEHKGNIRSESAAALAGGITTVCIPPDTNPVIDTPAVIDLIQQRAQAIPSPTIHTLGAMSIDLAQEQLSEIGALKAAGCIGLGSGLRAIHNSQLMRNIMDYAASFDLKVYLTPLNRDLENHGLVHEGRVSTRLGLPGIPVAAETTAVARDLALIEATGVKAHFCRLSCERSIEKLSRAQQDGLPVSADVAAHQLFLTDTDLLGFDSRCHVRPPLRTQYDREALRKALGAGVISAICSDHQPHEADAKQAPFGDTEPGISALETLLPLTLKLCQEGLLEPLQAIALLTSQPAQILGIGDQAGALSAGMPADIAIIDPDTHWNFDAAASLSKGKNTPFDGWAFQGRVRQTLIHGKQVFSAP